MWIGTNCSGGGTLNYWKGSKCRGDPDGNAPVFDTLNGTCATTNEDISPKFPGQNSSYTATCEDSAP
jgi:hypothetical protein